MRNTGIKAAPGLVCYGERRDVVQRGSCQPLPCVCYLCIRLLVGFLLVLASWFDL